MKRSSSADSAARFLALRGPSPSKKQTWSGQRRATLARDEKRCRKCWATSSLDVHHKLERVYGGTDDLENLITLCSDCHCEWTFCEPSGMDFERWRGLPPARVMIGVFAEEWPTDISADEFKQRLLNGIAMLMVQRRDGGG